MPDDDIEVALGVDRIVATLRRWARNANEQGAHEAVVGLLVAADEIERLRAERDEARRMYCDLVAAHGLAPRYDETGYPEEVTEGKQFARRLRWHCFPEVTP